MEGEMSDEAKHTPEPWFWDQGDIGEEYSALYCDIYVDLGDFIVASVNHTDVPIGRANAARIVACVNACAGIPTEQLEAGCVRKLVASLQDAIDPFEYPTRNLDGSLVGEPMWVGYARAAIAPFDKN